MLKAKPSRKLSRPARWSTSPFVSATALMGLLREPARTGGASSGVAATCWRRSGEALNRAQVRPSRLTASDDWVRLLRPGLPARASAQFRQLQLICGKPPPAAEPRTLISIGQAQVLAR